MTDTNGTTPFPEAIASWNTRYVTVDGFTCQLTLRGDNGKDLLEKADSALAFLRNQGCIPFYGYQKFNDHQDETNQEKAKNQDSNNDPVWCPIHQVEMRRYSKNGKSWYSHKLEDGTWCSGKPKNGKKD
jgi:hypothetical protein